MGLVFNADIAAPIISFVAIVTRYLHGCYLNLQTKYKAIKEIIYQEWHEKINVLGEGEIPKVANDTIPKKLFFFHM